MLTFSWGLQKKTIQIGQKTDNLYPNREKSPSCPSPKDRWVYITQNQYQPSSSTNYQCPKIFKGLVN